MDATIVAKKFSEMGARVKISEPRSRWNQRPFTIDIRRDGAGEFYDIQVKKEIEMLILDVQKKDRHLLLLTRDPGENPNRPVGMWDKSRFLCGHDERNWFTCAVPTGSTVIQAKQALKPRELLQVESQEGLKTSRAHKRHRKLNSGKKIHRQGEFMFIPETDFQPPAGALTIIHRHEPMSRGGGNSHFAEYLYRTGGEKVYVSRMSQKSRNVGLTEDEYRALGESDRKTWDWSIRTRNPMVFVKGKITHKEHRTLDLGSLWHRVVLNTENSSRGFTSVAFLD